MDFHGHVSMKSVYAVTTAWARTEVAPAHVHTTTSTQLAGLRNCCVVSAAISSTAQLYFLALAWLTQHAQALTREGRVPPPTLPPTH